MTVDEVREVLDTGEYDDVLDELQEAEENGQDRKGVADAIEDHR